MAHPDELEIEGLFKPSIDVATVIGQLQTAGATEDEIRVLTTVPLSDKASGRIGGIPLYAVTFVAGLLGIGVGVFFAAGTAAMYPLMTGGKPIIAPPIVGIVSYETMMLLAIVTTFLAMLVTIRHANATIRSKDTRIDDGRIAVVVHVPRSGTVADSVREVFDRAGAIDVRITVSPPVQQEVQQPAKSAVSVLLIMVLMGGMVACSKDMQEQPSFRPQEPPRVHSPEGSVPRSSRSFLPIQPARGVETREKSAELYRINCLHCHGAQGDGDGPVAPFLKEPPANLKNDEIRAMADYAIYSIITHGKDKMPSFKGELSVQERWELAYFVLSLPHQTTAPAAQPERP